MMGGTDVTERLNQVLSQPGFDNLSSTLQDAVNRARMSGGQTGQDISNFLNGTWLGHSLHATLTDFTIGTLVSAGILDYLSFSRDDPRFSAGADTLLKLGLATVPATALAGVADWQYQPGRGRRFGLLHALINTTAATLLTGSLIARRGRTSDPTPGSALVMAGAGLGLLMAGAYVGGDLSFRFGIAVNRDALSGPLHDFTPVMDAGDLPEGRGAGAVVGDRTVALFKQGNQIFALNDVCPHMGCPLSDGQISNGSVTCQCHGSRFRLSDGALERGPATAPVHAYETRVRDGKIEIRSQPGTWME